MKSILMRPELITKTVDGIKTHTRRCDQLKEINESPESWRLYHKIIKPTNAICFFFENEDGKILNITPRYQIGDIVYIKEAWCYKVDVVKAKVIEGEYWYKSDGVDVKKIDEDGGIELTKQGYEASPWISPMHLKALHARHFIKITSHEASRLQSIKPEDIIHEGIDDDDRANKQLFIETWDSINPLYNWKLNPHVIDYGYVYLKDKGE